MAERAAEVAAFLERHGWGGARHSPLAGDASFRRYERLAQGERTAVLMHALPHDEDVRPFLRIARHLRSLGLSAPAVVAEDAAAGLLLLEDLGEWTYTRMLAEGGDEPALYALAVDVLIHLHRHPPGAAIPEGTGPYDDARLLDESVLLTDWYLPSMLQGPTPAAVRRAFVEAWHAVFPLVHAQPRTLVLRDFHVDNLMWLADRDGIARCGLLDFQDALAGPAAYDLMSLLEDARRDVSEALARAMMDRYAAAFPDLDRSGFGTVFTVLAAQRHAKVIGIFTRLCIRDGKPGYLHHIPRLWRLLERALADPALAPVRDWFDRYVAPEARGIPECRAARA